MQKQIFFAHSAGAQGNPGQGSYDLIQWTRTNLDQNYHIHSPMIEDPEAPTFDMWKAMFDEQFYSLTGEVIFIGHSLGGSMLLKYFSEQHTTVQIKGLFLVAAPFWGLDQWEVDEFILRKNFTAYLSAIPSVHLFHCIDDPIVPFQHTEYYEQHFPHAHVHALPGQDHAFSDGLPILVKQVTEVSL